MNIEKKQCLLKYLDYYEGKVDGINGPMTEAAVADFRKDNGDDLDETLVSAVFYGKFKNSEPEVDFWSTVKYFGRHEFACKCGKYCDGYPVEPSEALVRFLDKFRDAVGLPVYINSGIRCATHNASAAVGGAPQSRHLYGDAADIRCPGKTPQELYDIANAMLGNSGGVGLYSWGIHVDMRAQRARW